MDAYQNSINLCRHNSCHLKTGLRAGELFLDTEAYTSDPCTAPYYPFDDGVQYRRCTNPDGNYYYVVA